MAKAHGVRLNRLKLYGSEAGGEGVGVAAGGQTEIIYSSISRNKAWFKTIANESKKET